MVETATFNNVEKEEVENFIRIISGLERNEAVPWESTGWNKAAIRGKELRMLEIRIDGVMIKYRLVMCPSPLPPPPKAHTYGFTKGKKRPALVSTQGKEEFLVPMRDAYARIKLGRKQMQEKQCEKREEVLEEEVEVAKQKSKHASASDQKGLDKKYSEIKKRETCAKKPTKHGSEDKICRYLEFSRK